jgi:hypothetical protein
MFVGASECPLLSRLPDEAFLDFIDSILFTVSEWIIHGGAALIVGMFEGLLPSRFHCIRQFSREVHSHPYGRAYRMFKGNGQ